MILVHGQGEKHRPSSLPAQHVAADLAAAGSLHGLALSLGLPAASVSPQLLDALQPCFSFVLSACSCFLDRSALSTRPSTLEIFHMILVTTTEVCSHFTDTAAGSERLSALPKVTQDVLSAMKLP